MNKIKTLFVILALLWVFPSTVFANNEFPQHHWQPEVTSYNMTAIFSISIDGVMQSSPYLELGVFAGEVCRSSYHLVQSPFPTGQYITEGYNIYGEEGEVLTFRLYDHEAEAEMNVTTSYTLPWVANGVVGNAVNPELIEFTSVASSYYVLITDESQLVSGRKYLIANGFEGTVKAMGKQNTTNRSAVDMACTNRKTYQTPAAQASEAAAFQFTLGGTAGAWTFWDEVNEGYLAIDDGGNLGVASTSCNWTLDLSPTGSSHISTQVGQGTNYIGFDNDSFLGQSNSSSLYVFAKCELVSGTKTNLAIDDPTRMLVVESGNTLEVTNLNTVNVSNLIIEDGAQLINASSGVQATLQKSITAYDDPMEHDGWYTLATPMTAAAVDASSNLVFPNYDLYLFDEATPTDLEWRNYKFEGNFTDFEAGRGYLYANAASFTPIFKGTLNSSSVAFPLTYTDSRSDVLKGFNLIGNPFPHNIYKGAGGAINDNALVSGYYVLTHSGSWLAKTYEMPIAPGQGVLVKTTTAHQMNIAKTHAVAKGESMSSKAVTEIAGSIGLHLSDGRVEDNAYVYLGPGKGLVKMAHFNALNPSLSIVQEEGDFAIAHVDASSETVDLRFDAKQAATYTITVDTKAYKKDYLHLVDNLTGADVDLLRVPSYTFQSTGHDHPYRFKLVLQGTDSEDDDRPFAYYSDGEIHLLVETFPETSLQIVDILGRMILSVGDVSGNVSTNGMAPGVYMLRLVDGEKVRTQKIVLR